MMRSSNAPILIAFAAGLLVVVGTSPAAAETLVVPSPLANVVGNFANSIPFSKSTSPSANNPVRYQQIYDASEFVEIGDVVTLSEIRFRIDEGQQWQDPTTFDLIEVRLSTTTKLNDALDIANLDNNLGSDDTQVFSGSFIWDACGVGTALCTPPFPQPFELAIPFSTPFVYDPTAGNLLLEVYNDDENPVSGYFLDAQNDTMDTTSRAFEVRNPETGDLILSGNSAGLVTQFVYTVPEAGTFGAAIAAMLALAGLRRSA